MRQWQNRIVGYEDVDPREVNPHPRNWRLHPSAQSKALSEIFGEVGIVQNVLINRRTGLMIDGHERLELALKRKQETLPATIVDLSEEEERLVLVTLDPTSAMAGTNAEVLAMLVEDIKDGHEGMLEVLDLKMPDFQPTEEEPKIICPKCGYEFSP